MNLSMRFAFWFTVDRHGLRPRDDKSVIFTMEGVMSLKFSFCHCEEGTEVSEAAIHCVSEDEGDLSLRLVRASGSPRAYALAMTECGRGAISSL